MGGRQHGGIGGDGLASYSRCFDVDCVLGTFPVVGGAEEQRADPDYHLGVIGSEGALPFLRHHHDG